MSQAAGSKPEPELDTEFDVLVVGGAGIDTIVRVPELPVPYADLTPP